MQQPSCYTGMAAENAPGSAAAAAAAADSKPALTSYIYRLRGKAQSQLHYACFFSGLPAEVGGTD